MCRQQLPQEEAERILAVGHKVEYQGQEAVIEGIRVWHDLGTLLSPHRYEVVFDLRCMGGVTNARFEDLGLWHPIPPLPSSPKASS